MNDGYIPEYIPEFLIDIFNIKREPDLRDFILIDRTFEKYLEIHNIDNNDIDEHIFNKYLLESGLNEEHNYKMFQSYHNNTYIDDLKGNLKSK